MNSIDDCELVNGHWRVANLLVRQTLIGQIFQSARFGTSLKKGQEEHKIVNLGGGFEQSMVEGGTRHQYRSAPNNAANGK